MVLRIYRFSIQPRVGLRKVSLEGSNDDNELELVLYSLHTLYIMLLGRKHDRGAAAFGLPGSGKLAAAEVIAVPKSEPRLPAVQLDGERGWCLCDSSDFSYYY